MIEKTDDFQGSAKKKKKKKITADQNLCKAPHMIQDGDLIGCFSSTEKMKWVNELYQTQMDKEYLAMYQSLKKQR